MHLQAVSCPYLVGPTDHAPPLLARLLAQQRRCAPPTSCAPANLASCRLSNPYFMPDKVFGEVITL